MRYGIAAFVTEHGIHPAELAERVEDRGFDSLFFPDHSHIPLASEMTYPWAERVPLEHRQELDVFVALTAAACATKRLQVGTGICLVVQRDPIITAKEVATLDYLSDGRFLFGIGAGWNLHEMKNHGTDPSRRFALMRERVEAMKAIWSLDEPSYHGEFVDFEPMWSWPKPVQQPHPPVLVGGNGPKVIDRVLAYGDEWLPEPEPGLTDRIRELRTRAEAAGRATEVGVTVYSAEVDDVASYTRAGAHRCVFWVPPNDAEGARRRVDELASKLHL